MPRKTTTTAPADQAVQPPIPSELLDQLVLDQLVRGPMTAGQVQGLFDQFKKALLERTLSAGMSHHMGYAPGQAKPEGVGNQRNGKSTKPVLTDAGALRIVIPRYRQACFEPQIIGEHERHFTGFVDKIIALYACGMTNRG
jgi:putative transposase